MSSILCSETVNTSFLPSRHSTSSSSRKPDACEGVDNLNSSRASNGIFNRMASVSAGTSSANSQHFFSFDSAPPKKRMKMIHDQDLLLQNTGQFVNFNAGQLNNNGSSTELVGMTDATEAGRLLSVPFTQHQQAFSNIGSLLAAGSSPFQQTINGISTADATDGTGFLQNFLFYQQQQQQQINDSASANASNILNAAMVSNMLNSNPSLAVSLLLNGLNGSTNNNLTQPTPSFLHSYSAPSSAPANPVNNLNGFGFDSGKSEAVSQLSPTDTTNLLNLLSAPDISALLSAILPTSTSSASGNNGLAVELNQQQQQVALESPSSLNQHAVGASGVVDIKQNIVHATTVAPLPEFSAEICAATVNGNKRRPSKRKCTKASAEPSPAVVNILPKFVEVGKSAVDAASLIPMQSRQHQQQQRPFKMYPKDALNLPIAGDVANQLNNCYAASLPLEAASPSPRRRSSGNTTKNSEADVSSTANVVPVDKTRAALKSGGSVTSTSSSTTGNTQTPLVNYSTGLDANDVRQLLASSSSGLSSALNDDTIRQKALQKFSVWKQERNAKGGRRANNTAKQLEVNGTATSSAEATSSQSPSSTTNPITSVVASNSPISPSTSSTTSGVAPQQNSRNTQASGNICDNHQQLQHAEDNTSTSGGTTIDGDNDEDSGSADGTPRTGRPRDASYWERRRKNNDAAKRSRDSRRRKEDEIALRCAFLECENDKLKTELDELKRETYELKCLLYNA